MNLKQNGIWSQVETVDKVYMVVGGAPDKSEHHVEDVALVALSFRDEINSKLNLHTAIPIQIRIGFWHFQSDRLMNLQQRFHSIPFAIEIKST